MRFCEKSDEFFEFTFEAARLPGFSRAGAELSDTIASNSSPLNIGTSLSSSSSSLPFFYIFKKLSFFLFKFKS